MFYSKSTNGFYDKAVHGKTMPADAVEISAEQYTDLMDGQGAGRSIVTGYDGKPALAPPEPPRLIGEVQRAAVAAERYKRETAGITLGGMQIDTGRDSQSLITGATVQAMLDPAYSLRWKTPVGFVEMTAEQIIGVASAARAHVQACFDREADLLDAIAAGTYTPAMLEEGWP